MGEFSLDLFASGVRELAERAGTEAVDVPAKHFPYVTIPQHIAHIVYEVDSDQSSN